MSRMPCQSRQANCRLYSSERLMSGSFVETMVGPVAHAIVGYSGGVWPPEQSRHREDGSMSESTTIVYVGLDVHKGSIAIAVASSDGKPAVSLGEVPNDIPALIKRLLRLGAAAALRC